MATKQHQRNQIKAGKEKDDATRKQQTIPSSRSQPRARTRPAFAIRLPINR